MGEKDQQRENALLCYKSATHDLLATLSSLFPTQTHLAMLVRLALCVVLAVGAVTSAFDPLQHSGAASPYFDAPSQDGIPSATPANCQVDQAAYILRHGSYVITPAGS